MRGIPSLFSPLKKFSRITPAHAGNTPIVENTRDTMRDHPRACGEYSATAGTVKSAGGSPPRMRGIQNECIWGAFPKGITPAHAGNTCGRAIPCSVGRDHPRACGEYKPSAPVGGLCQGSPPRMRGIPIKKYNIRMADGITPAHAGNTLKNPMI